MHTVKKAYRIISLMMAFLIFFTSVGFAVDMHFCRGQLKSISLFGEAKSCHDIAGKDDPMKNCPFHKKMAEGKEHSSVSMKKNCCSNRTVYFQSDLDQQIQTSQLVISKPLQQFILAYILVFNISELVIEPATDIYALYKPPLIDRDFPVLFESFLL